MVGRTHSGIHALQEEACPCVTLTISCTPLRGLATATCSPEVLHCSQGASMQVATVLVVVFGTDGLRAGCSVSSWVLFFAWFTASSGSGAGSVSTSGLTSDVVVLSKKLIPSTVAIVKGRPCTSILDSSARGSLHASEKQVGFLCCVATTCVSM